ncbi:MAG: vWA domain-containing protein, partial [Chitinophagaceae bacterium]
MNYKITKFFSGLRLLFMAAVLLLPVLLTAQIHKIDLPATPWPVPNPRYDFNINQPIVMNSAAVEVLTGNAQVVWNFGPLPGGATQTGRKLEYQGITIELPGDPGTPVANSLKVTITGTPTGTVPFTCSLEVSDPAFNSTSLGFFDVFIRQPTDVVLVLDKSGSMNTAAGSGTRWSALREAAKSFMVKYQLLRPQDRTALVYFANSATPPSNCCNTFITNAPTVPTLADKIHTELGEAAFQPGGGTAMGFGLQAGISKLSVGDNARNIILITDGEQNVGPQVNENGLGYDGDASLPATTTPGNIRIMTIGIGSPSGKFHNTLLKLATEHRGSYYVTNDGTAFTFKGGPSGGDMLTGFNDAFVNALAERSPQTIDISTHNIPANNTPVILQTFPVNKFVDKLLLEFAVGRSFELGQIGQLLARIRVEKDGALVMQYARAVPTGGFSNTVMLLFDFNNPPQGLPKLNPAGQWKVSISDSTLKFNACKLTTIVDDHRLRMKRTISNTNPKVNDAFPVSFNLDWMSFPIKNAKVEVVFVGPNDDMGDALANNPTTVDVSNAPDAGSPGVQKYNHLWATDSAFRNKFNGVENAITLAHTANGKYEGSYSGLNVAGLYRVIYRITGTDSAGGEIQRVMTESFYTSFSSLDMTKSAVTTTMQNGQLVMNFRPKTSYNKFIGPALGNAFSVSNPGIKIENVVDHQDGRYTITFTGSVTDTTSLVLLGQTIYTGKLENAGKGGGILDSIKKWFEDRGLPFWLFWLILILLIIII